MGDAGVVVGEVPWARGLVDWLTGVVLLAGGQWAGGMGWGFGTLDGVVHRRWRPNCGRVGPLQ